MIANFSDVKNQITEYTEFNLLVPEREINKWFGNEFDNAPECYRERFGPFLVGIYGKELSIMGSAEDFQKASWWKEIEKDIIVDNIAEDVDVWEIYIKEN